MTEGLGGDYAGFAHFGDDSGEMVARVLANLSELQARLTQASGTDNFSAIRTQYFAAIQEGIRQTQQMGLESARSVVAAFRQAAEESRALGTAFAPPGGAPLATYFEQIGQRQQQQIRQILSNAQTGEQPLPLRVLRQLSAGQPGTLSRVDLRSIGFAEIPAALQNLETYFRQAKGELTPLIHDWNALLAGGTPKGLGNFAAFGPSSPVSRPGMVPYTSSLGPQPIPATTAAEITQMVQAELNKGTVFSSRVNGEPIEYGPESLGNNRRLFSRFLMTVGVDPNDYEAAKQRSAAAVLQRDQAGNKILSPNSAAYSDAFFVKRLEQEFLRITRGGTMTETALVELARIIATREAKEREAAALETEQAAQLALANELQGKVNAGLARRMAAGRILDLESGLIAQPTTIGKGADSRTGYYYMSPDDVKAQRLRDEEAAKIEAEAQKAQALERSANPSGFSAFAGGFTQRGYFDPKQGVNLGLGGLAGTAGQFLRYSVVGAGIGAITGLFADTVAEAKDFSDSLTDVQNAIGSTNEITVGYIGTLQELSRVAGANVGSALDAAARSMRAFGDVGSDTPAKLREIGHAGAQAATQLSVISGKSLRDATGDMVAISNAFFQNNGFGANQKTPFDPSRLKEIGDAVANARRLGGDPKEIAQGLASVAESASQAGYSLNETASVLSLVIAKTDESGSAAATRLSRIFQIFQGGSGQSALASVGIDVSQSIKKQIEDLAALLPSLDKQKQNFLIGRLGGTANLRELLPLLQDQGALQKNFDSFLKNPGQGQKYFLQQTQNFAGLLKKIAGDIKNIQVDLVQSDIFAPIAIGLKVLEPALHALDKLLNIYDRLPGPLKTLIALTAEYLAVSAALTAIHAKQAEAAGVATVAETRLGTAEVASAEKGIIATAAANARAGATGISGALGSTGVGVLSGAMYGRAAGSGLSREFTAGAGVGRLGFLQDATTALPLVAGRALQGASAVIGSLAESFVNPMTAAIGGLLVLGSGQQKYSEFNAAIASASDGLKSLSHATSSSDFASAVSGYGAAKQQADAASSGFLGTVGLGLGGIEHAGGRFLSNISSLGGLLHPFSGVGAAFTSDATRYNAVASALQVSQRLAERAAGEAANTGSSRGALATQLLNAQDLSSGLQQLSSQGVNATDRLHALASALGLVADKAGAAATKSGFYGTTGNLSALGGAALDYFSSPTFYSGNISDTDKTRYLATVQGSILNTANQLGLSADKPLTDAQKQALVTAVTGASAGFKGKGYLFNDKDLANVRDALLSVFVKNALVNTPTSAGPLTNEEVMAVIQAANDRAGEVNPLDINGGRNAVRAALNKVNLAISRGTQNETAMRTLIDEKNQLESQLEDQITQGLERLRTALQSKAKNKAEVKRIGRDFFRREILVNVNNTNKLIEIMNNANSAEVALIEQELRDLAAIKAAAARAEAAKLAALSAAGAFDTNPKEAQQQSKAVTAANAAAASAAAAANNVTGAAKQSTITPGSNTGGFDTGSGSTFGQGSSGSTSLTAAQLAALAAEANVPVGNDLLQASADIQSARADMAAATAGSQEYYSALKQLHQAQFEYATALQTQAHNERLLRIDLTDPVAMAREDLRTALAKLRMDQNRGAGSFVTDADKVQVKQDQNALERTAFEQRLQDAQTNDELGRISHAAYLRYLTHEHDRLSAIKNRTRQQQDELNEVDQAIKAANQQLSGQFNLGDIKVPTPYEVRRAIKVGGGGVTTQAVTNNNQTLTINGADFDKVKAYILKVFGNQATGAYSTGSRK